MSSSKFRCNGDDIRRMRMAAKKTTQEMADLVGISRQTYENYENRVSKFPYEYFEIWCEHCDINLSAIFAQFLDLRKRIDETALRRKSPGEGVASKKSLSKLNTVQSPKEN